MVSLFGMTETGRCNLDGYRYGGEHGDERMLVRNYMRLTKSEFWVTGLQRCEYGKGAPLTTSFLVRIGVGVFSSGFYAGYWY